MLTKSIRRTLLATTIITGSLTALPAFAQDAPAVEDSGVIVVTGSRVARPNAESASPITTVGSEDIKEFGATKIEDLANALPQVFAGQSSGVSNGADGTATVNLRGLGSNRTVVLIDGKRLQPASAAGNSAADLNFIPAALISGVDLLTGGASAAYGADAVAGVVNFKMNRKFKGIRLDAQYGFYQHNNNNPVRSVVNRRFVAPEGNVVTGGALDASIALGSGFDEDRGSFVVYAGYRSETAVTQDKYDYSTCVFNPSGLNTGTVDDYACGGSGTPAATRFGGISAANAALAGIPVAGSYTLTGANGLVPYVALRDAFNFAPLNYYRRPSERYNLGAFAQYEISPALVPYLDVMFNDYSTQAQIAPSGAFFGTRTINCDNPFLTTGNRTAGLAICGANLGVAGTTSSILLGKRNVEGGPRFNDIGYNQFRIVTGLKGEISDAWSYDAYFQTGTITFAQVYRNDVSDSRINEALLVTGTLANPVCTSGNTACVPYNVFSTGGVTQAAAGYIGVPLVLTGKTRQTVVQGSITGDLGTYGIKSPFSEDGVRMAIGVERRTEALATQPDQSYINGDGAGQGGPTLPIDGQYAVTDYFGELLVPLVTDTPFFQDLSLEFGYRHSKYDVRGATKQNSTDTYKIAGKWSPIDDLTFRASYNRAVRSPNIGELFTNQSIGLFAGEDPCTGAAVGGLVNGLTAAQCARTGVTAAQFGNLLPNTAQQYNFLGGGNLNLNPEKSDSYSFGAVLKPASGILSGLVLSVDYFKINVKDAVGGIGQQVIIDQCIATNDPFFCNKITRSPASAGPAAGSLWLDESGFIDDRTTNTGSLKTSGIDVNADYRVNIGENKVRWQFVGTWLDKLIVQPLTNGFDYDCAGFYGITCGNPNPEFRFNTNVKFTTANNIGLTVRWRHFASVKVDGISPDADLGGNTPTKFIDEKIPAYNYFDLLLSLPIKDTATFRIGVNNIFDKDPAIVSQANLPGTVGNGNTFPGTYDALGRYVFVNLTADF